MPLVEGEAINLYEPQPGNLPAEWRPVPEHVMERLQPKPENGLLLDRSQVLILDAIAGQRWFLLRNVWSFRSRPTGRDGAVETHYTLAGIERPFRGTDAIWGFFRKELGNDADATRFFREALKLGAIEPITIERARVLCTRIFMKCGRDLLKGVRHAGDLPRVR